MLENGTHRTIAAATALILILGAALAAHSLVAGQGASPTIKITIDHNTADSATPHSNFSAFHRPPKTMRQPTPSSQSLTAKLTPTARALTPSQTEFFPTRKTSPKPISSSTPALLADASPWISAAPSKSLKSTHTPGIPTRAARKCTGSTPVTASPQISIPRQREKWTRQPSAGN